MRQLALAVLAFVATALVCASVLPPPSENSNNSILAARDGGSDKQLWCFCEPGQVGVNDVLDTVFCCPDNFDGDLFVCNHLSVHQAYDFSACCDNHQAMCGDVGGPPPPPPNLDRTIPAEITRRKDDDVESWCYCDSNLESKDDSETDMCCPTGHYDIDLLVCSYLQSRQMLNFEQCCAQHEVVCGINGTDPSQATVRFYRPQPDHSSNADIKPRLSFIQLDECYAGLKGSKDTALTKKCCPGRYFDEHKGVCQNLTPSREHDFVRCLPDHVATCVVQTPKAVEDSY